MNKLFWCCISFIFGIIIMGLIFIEEIIGKLTPEKMKKLYTILFKK